MEDINRAMELLHSKTNKMAISLAKIEQHLKDMNGAIFRHQKNIDTIEEDMKKMDQAILGNKVALAKIMGAAITGSAIGGVLISVVLRIIGM